MDALDALRFDRKNAVDPLLKIGTVGEYVKAARALPPTGIPLDASPRPTPEHMGLSALEYLKGNIMGRAPEGKWLDPSHQRVGGKEEERLYAEPEYNWEVGEVDPVFHGGGRFKNIQVEEGPGFRRVGKAKNPKELIKFIEDDYVANPAIRINNKIIEGDYSKGGHIEILDKIDRDPKLKAEFDAGNYAEGVMTVNGNFFNRRPDIDFSEIKGRKIKEIWDLLE